MIPSKFWIVAAFLSICFLLSRTVEGTFAERLIIEEVPNQFLASDIKAQEEIDPPVNLSQSGAASQPRIVVSPDGIVQAFWIDQFDGLMTAVNRNGSWSEPEALNENINSTFSENSVSISPDGNTLYFSSDRPITADKTDLDIYYSKKDRRGEWGTAKNIGSVINTEFDEDGPFIDYDGKTLYFSSKEFRWTSAASSTDGRSRCFSS